MIVEHATITIELSLLDNKILRLSACGDVIYVGSCSPVGLEAAREAVAIELSATVERMRAR